MARGTWTRVVDTPRRVEITYVWRAKGSGGDRVPGWQVGVDEFRRFPPGTPVRVVVSGDRQYLYEIQPR